MALDVGYTQEFCTDVPREHILSMIDLEQWMEAGDEAQRAAERACEDVKQQLDAMSAQLQGSWAEALEAAEYEALQAKIKEMEEWLLEGGRDASQNVRCWHQSEKAPIPLNTEMQLLIFVLKRQDDTTHHSHALHSMTPAIPFGTGAAAVSSACIACIMQELQRMLSAWHCMHATDACARVHLRDAGAGAHAGRASGDGGLDCQALWMLEAEGGSAPAVCGVLPEVSEVATSGAAAARALDCQTERGP